MQINPIDEHRADVEVKFHCKKKTKKEAAGKTENVWKLEARTSREREQHISDTFSHRPTACPPLAANSPCTWMKRGDGSRLRATLKKR